MLLPSASAAGLELCGRRPLFAIPAIRTGPGSRPGRGSLPPCRHGASLFGSSQMFRFFETLIDPFRAA